MGVSVYQVVCDNLMSLIEKTGLLPWQKPWGGGDLPYNLFGKNKYTGVNVWLLGMLGYSVPAFATLKQILAHGGRVKPEEFSKGHIVIYWLCKEKVNKQTGEKETWRKLLYYRVYNVVEQTSGLEKYFPKVEARPVSADAKHEAAEAILAAYTDGPRVTEGHTGRACYIPSADAIEIPAREQFSGLAAFYGVLFHEHAHGTGHESRLNRTIRNGFGSEPYGKEELVAEFASAYLLNVAGFTEPRVNENQAAYLAHWKIAINANPSVLVTAARAAQNAADWIQNKRPAKAGSPEAGE